jgi:hypothetical protein
MKRITRLIPAGPDKGKRVWLNQFGSWTQDEGHAFVFDDAEATRRLKRLAHASLAPAPTATLRKEIDDV